MWIDLDPRLIPFERQVVNTLTTLFFYFDSELSMN